MRKFIESYIRYKLHSLLAGRKNYDAWKAKNYSLKKTKIKNIKLAKELETACWKKEGFLTYSEYLYIGQFGKNGYHANHSLHGTTDVHENWPKALALLCKDKNLNQIIEFGPGEGFLAGKLIKESLKINHAVKWIGVEINTTLVEKIKKEFKKAKLEKYLQMIVPSIEDFKISQKSLVIFPYSLDSIPPEIFVNTTRHKSPPDSLIGIIVKDGTVTEIIPTKEQLSQKGLSLEKGIYKDISLREFDLNRWQLYEGQRAYIPVAAFSILAQYVSSAPKETVFIIMDEFRPLPFPWETNHLCLPKDLHVYERDCSNIEKSYEEAGNRLLYYPTYFITFLKLLHTLGFRSIQYDIEHKLAKELTKEKWRSMKGFYLTYAFIASNRMLNLPKVLELEFPKSKLL